jgi:signal transduction histidine kinase
MELKIAVAQSTYAGFEESYRALLAQTVEPLPEQLLAQAYALGRTAVNEGLRIADILSVHQDAAAKFVKESRDPVKAAQTSLLVLQEALSPFDVTLRGIEEANESLSKVNDLLKQEAQRIAQALHDEAGQLIATLSLAVQCLGCGHQSPCGNNNVNEIQDLVRQADLMFRRMSHEMRPQILDEMGLVPAIELLANGFSQHRGLEVDIRNELAERLCPITEWSVYRMIQVALPNVVTHAKASRVTIHLALVDGWVKCAVIDDGIGVGAKRSNGAHSGGLGLLGIQERAETLGGRVVVSPVLPHGTDVSIYIPLIK